MTKAIDRWAREYGHADYDTFIRAGGSVGEAMRDISRRIRSLQLALNSITAEPPNPQLVNPDKPYVWPEHVAPKAPDEPPDPDNAHIQGADG
jgi:hypothetical protein